MDSFVFIGDYAQQIQSDNLNQLIGNNTAILDRIQSAAQEEMESYLKQKYDVSTAFTPILKFDPAKTYNAGQTVYLDATAYAATATYALNALTLEAGSVYLCKTAITVAEAFDAAKWTLLGDQYDTFFVAYPQAKFDNNVVYAVGDNVFWKNKVYTAKIATQQMDHEAKLQVDQAATPSIVNIFPDDKKDGVKYWGAGTAFAGAGSDLPVVDQTTWTAGDNRSQKLVEVCVTIILYKANMRISPRNVSPLRIINYMGNDSERETRGQRVLYPTYSALGWLQAAAIGNDITPELPLIQPSQGRSIRYGGRQKNINSY